MTSGESTDRRMRFRKLRIAFSVTCLIACVLLIVLWVRSSRWSNFLLGDGLHDVYVGQLWETQLFAIVSTRRHLEFCWFTFPPGVLFPSGFSQPPERVSWYFEAGITARYFGITSSSDGRSKLVLMPHWVPIVITGVLAAVFVPSLTFSILYTCYGTLRRIRIPARFSLRTLLIATTLVAVVLGLIVYAVR
jgi:hypothetical protein